MRSNIICSILVLLTIVFVLLFYFRYVPFNTDEFCHYIALSYHYYPLNSYNTFRTSAYDLYLSPFFGLYFPLRSYYYTGSIGCLFYFPLFIIWKNPNSVRLLGILFLLVQSICIQRLFKWKYTTVFLFIISFLPYSFQHIVDTGPISFQTTSIFIIAIILLQWKDRLQNHDSWKYPIYIGILIFLCIWIKPIYFCLLPGIFILILSTFSKNRTVIMHKYKFIKHMILLISAALIPCYVLLQSVDRGGHTYFNQLQEMSNRLCNSGDYYEKLTSTVIKFIGKPLFACHRIFIVPHGISIIDICYILTILSMLCYGLFKLRKKIFIPLFYLTAGIVSLLLIALVRKPNAMHHFVLSFPFFILFFCATLRSLKKDKFIKVLMVIFVVINLRCFMKIINLTYEGHSHPCRYKLIELLDNEFGDKYVFIYIDWGYYHMKSLYGNKNMCNLYMAPFHLASNDDVQRLKIILKKLNRKALFIGQVSSKPEIESMLKAFPNLTIYRPYEKMGDWRIWYEE